MHLTRSLNKLHKRRLFLSHLARYRCLMSDTRTIHISDFQVKLLISADVVKAKSHQNLAGRTLSLSNSIPKWQNDLQMTVPSSLPFLLTLQYTMNRSVIWDLFALNCTSFSSHIISLPEVSYHLLANMGVRGLDATSVQTLWNAAEMEPLVMEIKHNTEWREMKWKHTAQLEVWRYLEETGHQARMEQNLILTSCS